jgi:hypothetical protein
LSTEGKGYGKQVVERLASDLQKEFPGIAGFSAQNMWFMRSFYRAWAGGQQRLSQPVRESPSPILLQPVRELSDRKLPQPVAESVSTPPEPMASLPWGHNLVLLHKLKSAGERRWYAHEAVEHGWSRAVLVHWIESDLTFGKAKP